MRSTPRSTTRSTTPQKLLTSVALVGSLFGLAACGGGGGGGAEGGEGSSAAASQPASGGGSGEAQAAPEDAQPSMPEPEVENIPEVVATVNGQEISGEEFTTAYEGQFQQMAMQSQMSGQEMNQDEMKKQLAESMVGTELLVQDAQEQGHEASEEDVNAFLEETAEASGVASVDELLATFEEQGFSEEQIRSDAEKQLMLNQTIEQLDIPEPSDEELKELYDSSIAAQSEAQGGQEGGAEGESAAPETPSFEELKPQLEQQVSSQKENEALTQRIGELREGADVQIKL
ncbi:SurA N-terminal domain-containing protein [Citricoccus sp. I39-566]|uniref:SurA N-terminal domain-containing protein n=1 Tax=Citricoccus sp. I39-566 TaxID=3073268 RepID=UPI00286A51DF|nr:SurA N-terminal domain-containing protein [Citricoccus sp. I39-566]WMY77826.1 SurA N-terminal domain-containing protein [Citricoccus sp. I39-566]